MTSRAPANRTRAPSTAHAVRTGHAADGSSRPRRADDAHPFYRMPEVYDILHAAGTATEVRGLERIARLYSRRPRDQRSTWLEPACGTARYLRLAHRRGHNVIGIDSSPEMIAYARDRLGLPAEHAPSTRGGAAAPATAPATANPATSIRSRGAAPWNCPRRQPWDAPLARSEPRRGAPPVHRKPASAPAPTANLLLADMTSFSHLLPARSIDFAFNLINTIRHLPDDASMLAHFEQMARVLRPGAVYAVGLGLASYGLEIPTEDIWLGRRARIEVRQCVQYLPAPGGRTRRARAERCINHLTIQRPSGTEEIDFVYDLRSYDLRQWTRLVSRSALEITRAVDEDGQEITVTEPGYAIFLLRRR